MDRRKKAVLLLWTYIVLLTTPKIKSKNNKEVIYNEDYIYELTPYAKLGNEEIFIVGKEYAEKYVTDNSPNIYIIDDRLDDDPDISICNSYKYKDIDDINTILNLLLEYEANNPSLWNRSFKSMKDEWLMHNICYYLHIQKDRTKQVDFNNGDEEIYLSFIKFIKEVINTHNKELLNIKTRALTKNS